MTTNSVAVRSTSNGWSENSPTYWAERQLQMRRWSRPSRPLFSPSEIARRARRLLRRVTVGGRLRHRRHLIRGSRLRESKACAADADDQRADRLDCRGRGWSWKKQRIGG